MIDSITIRNFQSHEDSTIEFSPGLTVLVGTSDIGKSAVVRALNWVLNNRPRGKSFIRQRSDGDCNVLVHSGDHKVMRRRCKKDNEYFVNGEVFEALGSDVPEAVKEALPLTAINVASQLEPHFLILNSPGQIASALNDVAHLQDAQSAVGRLSSDLRRDKAELTELTETEKTLKTSVERFARLEGVRGAVDRLRVLQDDCGGFRGIFGGLKEVLGVLEQIDQEDPTFDLPDGFAALVDETEKEDANCRVTRQRFLITGGVVGDLKVIRKKLKRIPDLDKIAAVADEVQTEEHKMVGTERVFTELDNILQRVAEFDEGIDDLNDEIKTANKQHVAALKRMDECPTCEQPINDEQRERVLENVK